MPRALGRILESGTHVHGYESVRTPTMMLDVETITALEAEAEGWTLYEDLPPSAQGAPAWRDPTAGDEHEPYDEGAWAIHQGSLWRSTQADNANEPGSAGWEEIG
jgi:hypothetical protein